MAAKKSYACNKCHLVLKEDNFYKTNNMEKYGDREGYMHTCKKCATMHVDNWRPETFLPLLEDIDVPWIEDEWNKILGSCLQSHKPITNTTVLGRYLSKMRMNQWKDYRWKDNEIIRQQEEFKMRVALQNAGYGAAEIDKAILEHRIPMPEKPPADEFLEMAQPIPGAPAKPSTPAPKIDYGLTEQDRLYLSNKWGKDFPEEDWIKLEQFYNDMMRSYDIQTAGHKDTLKLLCKASLTANKLIDMGDIDGFQKASRVYNDLMRSGNFTAVQNKTDLGEFVDSVGELVAICETDGFIPRYYVETPNDKVDRVLQDLQHYTRSLIMEETNLGAMLESAMKQIQIDKQKGEEITLDDEDDDSLLEAELFDDTTAKEPMTDEDVIEYHDWLAEE